MALDPWANVGRGFNRAAADAVVKAMLAMDPDEALVFGRMVVAESVRQELIVKRAELDEVIDREARRRVSALKKRLARESVAKARANADAGPEIEALAAVLEISKAYDPHEVRDEHGRWARHADTHVRIGYDPGFKALHDSQARNLGIPTASGLEGKDLARYQQAYLQLAQALGPYQRSGGTAGDLAPIAHLNIRNKDGSVAPADATINDHRSDHPVDLHPHLKDGATLTSATVSVAPKPSMGGALYDAFDAVGMKRTGATLAGQTSNGVLDPQRLSQFRTALDDRAEQDEFIPSQRAFRNLQHGSRLLSDSLGPAAPHPVKYALAVGEHVGQLGPQAQRVLGPTADRAAYRYRGTERPISPDLASQIDAIARMQATPASHTPMASPRDKREYMLHGDIDTTGKHWMPSNVVSYFRRQLPSVELNTLQLKSGHVPPSRGVVINNRRQVVHESVGFGDDWYLPFNLKNLKDLKGGEFIRTRTYGGPTTEDLYTGLMSGARAFTVVSHNGVYTVDLNDNLRGGRRFNDKALRMTSRYGQLLDAVKSEQVQLGGIHPSRLHELEEEAASKYDPDDDEKQYEAELAKLKLKERKTPTLSEEQRTEAAHQFLLDWADRAGHRMDRDGNEGAPADPAELIRQLQGRAAIADHSKLLAQAKERGGAQAAAALANDPSYSAQAMLSRRMEAIGGVNGYEAAERTADAIGARPQFDRAMEDAAKENTRSMLPLRLNGEGYKIALDALQEQFPYYIDRVEFHEWPRTTVARSTTDSGYVKPRHTRAHQALSGYFEHDAALGQVKGKVYADSTRHQNNRSVRPFNTDAERAADAKRAAVEDKEGRVRGSTGAKTGDAGDKDSKGITGQVLQARADHAYAEALRDPELQVDSPDLPDKNLDAYSGPLRVMAADAQFKGKFPGLAALTAPGLDLDALKVDEPAKLHSMVERAHAEAQLLRAQVKPDVVAAFKGGGRAKGSNIGEHPVLRLDGSLDKDWRFGDDAPRVLRDGVDPHPSDVENAYKHDKPVWALGLGSLTEPDFMERAAAIQQRLNDDPDNPVNRAASRLEVSDAQWQRYDRQADSLLRAVSYHRRFHEGTRREAERVKAERLRADAADRAHDPAVSFDAKAGRLAVDIDPADADSVERGRAMLDDLLRRHGKAGDGKVIDG